MQTAVMKRALLLVLAALLAFFAPALFAQGQDSTPGERYVRVLAQLLPGVFDNANQSYFDRRRGLADNERHERINISIEKIEAPAFGEYVFAWTSTLGEGEQSKSSIRLVALSAGGSDGFPDEVVVMRHYFDREGRLQATAEGGDWGALKPTELASTAGCEYLFRRRADSFRGAQSAGACRVDWQGEPVYTDNTIELSAADLFVHDHKYRVATGERITGVASGEPFWLERARIFHCFVDMPGVGGGRDEPFERYDNIRLHDKGGSHWLSTRSKNPQQLGIALQAVSWHVLNEDNGNFNRDSLVVYIMERLADGTVKEHGYGFTEPEAERIGVNLKWMLVNCALVPPAAARPTM